MNNRRITLMRPSQIFDSFVDEFFNTPSLGFGRSSNSNVSVNMFEDDKNVNVEIIAPGFSKDNLEIKIERGILTISGKVTEEKKEEDKKKNYLMEEYRAEQFSRSIALPSNIDSSNAEAKQKDGKFVIVLPKKEGSDAKTLTISE